MSIDVSINYLHVIVAGIAAWLLGWLWYSNLFQKPWMKEMGLTMEMLKQNAGKGLNQSMIGGALSAIVTAWVLAYEVAGWHVADGMGALQLAFWLWLGFTAMVQLDSVFYEKRSWKLFAINTSYRFCAILVSALVLTLWK